MTEERLTNGPRVGPGALPPSADDPTGVSAPRLEPGPDTAGGAEAHHADQADPRGDADLVPGRPADRAPPSSGPPSSPPPLKGLAAYEQMSTRDSTTIGVILIVALLAGLIAIALMFKAADDAEQAVAAASAASAGTGTAAGTASAGTASTGTPTRSAPGTPLPASAGSAQPVVANSAVIGPWVAPRIPLLGVQLTPNVSLLALAASSGFVGALVHTLTVLASRRGAHTLGRSYGLWYLSTPVTGAALAVLFFAAIHIGVLATGGAGAAGVNLFGVVVFGGLAGLFARKVSDKLAEVLGDVSAVARKPDPAPTAPDPPAKGGTPSGQVPTTDAAGSTGNGTKPSPGGPAETNNSRPGPP